MLTIKDKFNFGKYKGQTIEDIIQKDVSYVVWCLNNVKRFKLSDSDRSNIMKRYEKVQDCKSDWIYDTYWDYIDDDVWEGNW